MKAIIYAGIGIFSAASIYGVVDYYNTNSKGVLDKIYQDDVSLVIPQKEIAVTTVKPANVQTEVKATEANKKGAVVKSNKKKLKSSKVFIRDFKFSNFSRGRIMPKEVVEEIKKPEPVFKQEIKQ